MENASKALLMAGGILLVIVLISLFLYAWSLYSDFYASQQELADIEDTAQFNLQFTNFDRDDVGGYEIISIANKIADYNIRYSNTGTNDENYLPITLTVNLVSTDLVKNLTYDGNIRLFTAINYTQNDSVNQIANIISEQTGLETSLRRNKYCFKNC